MQIGQVALGLRGDVGAESLVQTLLYDVVIVHAGRHVIAPRHPVDAAAICRFVHVVQARGDVRGRRDVAIRPDSLEGLHVR